MADFTDEDRAGIAERVERWRAMWLTDDELDRLEDEDEPRIDSDWDRDDG